MSRLKTLKPRVSIHSRNIKTVEHGSWRANAPSNRGYNARWRKLRAEHLVDHPFCVMCLASTGIDLSVSNEVVIIECARKGIDIPYGNVVDHIKPHRGNPSLMYDRDNLQTLCKRHHDSDKQREEIRDQYGRL